MSKLKAHSGLKKRFKVSATGKVSGFGAGSNHYKRNKTNKRLSGLRKRIMLPKAQAHNIKQRIYGG